jgi:D-alanyl-D-alanine carboxypeptidase
VSAGYSPRMRAPLTLVAALALTLLPGTANATNAAHAADRPLDTATLGADVAAVRAVGASPRVGVVARVSDGDQSWASAVGSAAPGVRATRDARFRAASITKQLVATLAMQQVESGEWTLGTRVGDVLPNALPGHGRITLRQLLSHTSGLPEHLVGVLSKVVTQRDFVKAISQPRQDRELVRAVRNQTWLARPGTEFHYSNSNFVVVGMMLERATGQSVRSLITERITELLRMTDSTFAVRPGLSKPALKETAQLGGVRFGLGTFDPTLFSSSGALVTTTRDLDRFQEGLSTLVSPASLRQMRKLVAPKDSELEYGLGTYRLPDPCEPGEYVYGHDGGSYGTLSMSFARPDASTRVTLATTGRIIDTTDGAQSIAMLTFVFDAFASSCGGGTATRSSSGETVLPASWKVALANS